MFPFHYAVSYRSPVVVGTDRYIVVIGSESTIIHIKGHLLYNLNPWGVFLDSNSHVPTWSGLSA